MNQYQIYIPILRDSNKEPHHVERWQTLERSMLKAFGGFTRLAEVSGAWLDDSGNVVPDHSRVYSVGVAEGKDDLFRMFVQSVRDQFDQQCLYVAKVGTAELV